MKQKIFLVLAIALLIAACSPGQAQIEVEAVEFDFGEIQLGDTVWRDMQLSNTGSGELVIDRIVGSCDCTRGSVNESEIHAGGSTLLRISFDSAELYGEVVGPIVRSVYIYSNDPDQPELKVSFSGTIVRPQSVE
jgi:hypothetical protein